MRRARRQTRARPCCGNSGTATSASGRPPRRMRLMGVAAMPSAMNSVCAVWITRRMFCSRSSLRFTVCTSLRKVVYSMPCFHAVCNRKCAGWKHLCLARRGAAWYAHGRQRDSSPPERMSWPRRKSRPFFMTGFTGHKKRPDLIRGGPYPPRAPPRCFIRFPAASFERPR